MNIHNWSTILRDLSSNGDAHPILCEIWSIGQKERLVKVFTQEEYNNYFQTRSRWGNSCKKLSIAQIVSISNSVISNMLAKITFFPNLPIENALKDQIFKLITCGDALDVKWNANITILLNEIIDKLNSLSSTTSSLEELSKRSIQKHTAEKAKGIWGRIKWYIWSWFYDASTHIKKFKERMPCGKEVLESAYDSISSRAALNAIFFDVREGIIPEGREENDEYFNERKASFKTRHDIQIWLSKHHQDKYRLKSENVKDNGWANHNRSVMISLLKIWDRVDAHLKADKTGNQADVKPEPDLEAEMANYDIVKRLF